MKKLLITGLMMLVSVHCFAVEKTTRDLNQALGKWALDSIQSGVQNEELITNIFGSESPPDDTMKSLALSCQKSLRAVTPP